MKDTPLVQRTMDLVIQSCTMQVSLSKALKLKNRQAAKVADIQRKISASNSHLKGSKPDFEVKKLYAELKAEVEVLIDIKSKINSANAPIQPTIYRLAELKGLVSFLRGLNTQRGKVLAGYMSELPQDFEAQMDAKEVAAEIERLELQIDELQDALDAHNAGVRIDLEAGR